MTPQLRVPVLATGSLHPTSVRASQHCAQALSFLFTGPSLVFLCGSTTVGILFQGLAFPVISHSLPSDSSIAVDRESVAQQWSSGASCGTRMGATGDTRSRMRYALVSQHQCLTIKCGVLNHPVLPTSRRSERLPAPPIEPKEVTKIALRLKHQIEQVIPCELEEEQIVKAHSAILTNAVLETARAAGGEQHKACVVFCLLVVKKWFKKQSNAELWDADLHDVRAVAAEMMAKRLIEAEEDMDYLFEEVLLKRYSTLVDGEPTPPANAIEKAVDLHAVTVIGSSGYQKCINYLWRGWVVQDDDDPSRFVDWENKTNTNYWAHLDPDRMRVPRYQNWVQIGFSFLFLGLYTGAINTINPTGDLDVVEGLLYIFTVGFVCDEANKFWKVGRFYISFWNMFNSTLYSLLAVSFVLRMVALGHPLHEDKRRRFNELSYDFLAFTAPMFWMRLMLYLDTFRFFGAMLVVLKVMMRESLIFFALLIVVMIGFFQAFIGMDIADDFVSDSTFVIQAMLNAVMQSPEFSGFDNFSVSAPLWPPIQDAKV
jgi:hypothetical protein